VKASRDLDHTRNRKIRRLMSADGVDFQNE
jgi:hypothetical protein